MTIDLEILVEQCTLNLIFMSFHVKAIQYSNKEVRYNFKVLR